LPEDESVAKTAGVVLLLAVIFGALILLFYVLIKCLSRFKKVKEQLVAI